MKKLVVLVSGSGTNLQAIIDAIEKNEINAVISTVIANKPCYGIERAQQHNIPTQVLSHTSFESRESFDKAVSKIIDNYEADFVILAGFMRILSTWFVNHYQDKLINVHPALLPKHKGLNTHQRALDANDTEHGSTVHVVTPELDAGASIAQSSFPVCENDNATLLENRIKTYEHQLYPKVIALLCNDEIKLKNNEVYFQDKKLSCPLQIEHSTLFG